MKQPNEEWRNANAAIESIMRSLRHIKGDVDMLLTDHTVTPRRAALLLNNIINDAAYVSRMIVVS